MRSGPLSLVALAALGATAGALRIPVPVPPHSYEIADGGSLKAKRADAHAQAPVVARAAKHKRQQCPAKPPVTTPAPPPPPSTEAPAPPSTTDAPEPPSTEAPAPPSTTDAPAPPSTTEAPPPPSTTEAPAPPPTTEAPPPPPSTTEAPAPGGPTKTQDGAEPAYTKATDADPYLTELSVPLNYKLIPDFTSEKTGVMTYYGQGSVACGDTYDDTTYTAAISRITYDAWPGASASTNRNPVCGPFVDGRYFLLPSDERVPGASHATMGGDGLINCIAEQCHRPLTATVTNHAINASFTVHIVDRCEACAPGDIDLAPAAFLKLTVPELDTSAFALGDYMAEASKNQLGRVPVTWKFDDVQQYGQVRGQKKEGCWGGCVVEP